MVIQHNNSSPALLASRRASSSALSSSSSSDGAGGSFPKDTGGPAIPDDLEEILLRYRWNGSQSPCRHYDEIFTGLYLGDMKTARNVLTLEKLGITHVLNCAYTPSPFTDRETSEAYYSERNFQCDFKGIPALDFPSCKISQWFEETSEFIHGALKVKGRVLVHCQVGVSRSATVVIAYLMMKQKMLALDATQYVASRRPIFPNDGFLRQICELDYRLAHPTNALLRSFLVKSRRSFVKLFRSSSASASPSPATKWKNNNTESERRNSTSFFGNIKGRRMSLSPKR